MTYRTKTVEQVLAEQRNWVFHDTDQVSEAHKIDGIPCTRAVASFATALRAANKTLKFAPSAGNVHMCHQLYVYSDAHDYVFGEIGYGDYRIRGSGDSKYMVASRKIDHDRVGRGHEQQHMALSISLAQGVKNACKFLVPHTLEEIAAMSFDPFGKALRNARGEVINAARKFVDKCTDWRVIDTELRHLIRSGAQFITPEFQEAAAEFIRADAEAAEVKQRKVYGQYVQFREIAGAMRVNILTYNNDWSESYLMGKANSNQILASDLPEDLQGKIAMLSMVEKNAHVPGVGMKVSDKAFWLERVASNGTT